jgi:hypothetical protein
MEVKIMKKLFTQILFDKEGKANKEVLKNEIESARSQLEWSLRF